MKKIFLAISLLGACLVSISCTEKCRIEQNARTLAGSVTSIDPYYFEGEFDGHKIDKEDATLMLLQKSDDAFELSVRFIDEDLVNSLGINSLGTSPITLSGKAGDVVFDSDIDVSVQKVYKGKASGWIKSDVPTKTSPAQYNLTGEITLSWLSESQETHNFTINKIIR